MGASCCQRSNQPYYSKGIIPQLIDAQNICLKDSTLTDIQIKRIFRTTFQCISKYVNSISQMSKNIFVQKQITNFINIKDQSGLRSKIQLSQNQKYLQQQITNLQKKTVDITNQVNQLNDKMNVFASRIETVLIPHFRELEQVIKKDVKQLKQKTNQLQKMKKSISNTIPKNTSHNNIPQKTAFKQKSIIIKGEFYKDILNQLKNIDPGVTSLQIQQTVKIIIFKGAFTVLMYQRKEQKKNNSAVLQLRFSSQMQLIHNLSVNKIEIQQVKFDKIKPMIFVNLVNRSPNSRTQYLLNTFLIINFLITNNGVIQQIVQMLQSFQGRLLSLYPQKDIVNSLIGQIKSIQIQVKQYRQNDQMLINGYYQANISHNQSNVIQISQSEYQKQQCKEQSDQQNSIKESKGKTLLPRSFRQKNIEKKKQIKKDFQKLERKQQINKKRIDRTIKVSSRTLKQLGIIPNQTNQHSQKVKLQLQDGSLYFGQVKNGLFNGKGIYQDAEKNIYKGTWKNGKMEGYAYQFSNQGNRSFGKFIHGKRNGQGLDQYANGQRYQGEFKDDLKSGFGKYYYNNGGYYQGNWVQDKAHGKGRQVNSNNYIFKGNWKQDERHGKGVLRTAKGAQIGQLWKDGILLKQKLLRENKYDD